MAVLISVNSRAGQTRVTWYYHPVYPHRLPMSLLGRARLDAVCSLVTVIKSVLIFGRKIRKTVPSTDPKQFCRFFRLLNILVARTKKLIKFAVNVVEYVIKYYKYQ